MSVAWCTENQGAYSLSASHVKNIEKLHRFVRLKYELWQQVTCTAGAAVALHARPKVRKGDTGCRTWAVGVATMKRHMRGRSKSSYKTGTPAETAVFLSTEVVSAPLALGGGDTWYQGQRLAATALFFDGSLEAERHWQRWQESRGKRRQNPQFLESSQERWWWWFGQTAPQFTSILHMRAAFC